MIAYLRGKITQKDPTFIIVECNGIGYEVRISLNTFDKLRNLEEILIHTYFQVKEDSQTLFGFSDPAEKQLFELLLSISGVGGNTALVILSSIQPDELIRAVAEENTARLKQIKGIGAKTAGRIILELKDKLKGEMAAGITAQSKLSPGGANKEEAINALVSLGLAKGAMEKRVDQILKENDGNLSVEEIIKLALRNN